MPARLATASALIKQISPRDLRIETTLLPVVGAIQVDSDITNCLRPEGHTRIPVDREHERVRRELQTAVPEQNPANQRIRWQWGGAAKRPGADHIFAVDGSRKADSLGLGESRVSRSERKYPAFR